MNTQPLLSFGGLGEWQNRLGADAVVVTAKHIKNRSTVHSVGDSGKCRGVKRKLQFQDLGVDDHLVIAHSFDSVALMLILKSQYLTGANLSSQNALKLRAVSEACRFKEMRPMTALLIELCAVKIIFLVAYLRASVVLSVNYDLHPKDSFARVLSTHRKLEHTAYSLSCNALGTTRSTSCPYCIGNLDICPRGVIPGKRIPGTGCSNQKDAIALNVWN